MVVSVLFAELVVVLLLSLELPQPAATSAAAASAVAPYLDLFTMPPESRGAVSG
jgi:hypothetical protein